MAGVGGTKLDKDFPKVFLPTFVNFVVSNDNVNYLVGFSEKNALHFTIHPSSKETPAFNRLLCQPHFKKSRLGKP